MNTNQLAFNCPPSHASPKDLGEFFVPSMRGPTKSAFKSIMANPMLTMINMAGGMPNPNTFPILQLQARVKAPGATSSQPEDTLKIEKKRRNKTTECLDELLQYSGGCGQESYCNFLYNHTQRTHSPQYADWDVIASCGNTDAIDKALSLFCQPGDSVLVERWTFPGTLSKLAIARVKPVPVVLDEEGMVPADLDRVCSEWGGATPLRVLYVIPTGQNPTGTTMALARRKSIYAVAQKHNLVIIEDDPYYFLQLPKFTSSQGCDVVTDRTCGQQQALVSSLLSLDTDGRVIRLDSFSKILAPNLRCGWVTAPRYILDKIQILNETTTLQPSGLSQGLVSKLLNDTWGMNGWDAHICELRAIYTARRNHFVRMAEKHLSGLVEYTAPLAGMFMWMRVNFGAASADPTAMTRLLHKMNECGIMMAPGMPFSSTATLPSDHYLRAAFALVDIDMFEPALLRLAHAISTISGQPASVDDEAATNDASCSSSKDEIRAGAANSTDKVQLIVPVGFNNVAVVNSRG
ncbi:hypothetical protein LPJ66_005252 [Kickxella alabastrina]|uniref:Uncharacterized protein n=1 Tax=Kickxella alabastrina TaxID=61397 RepID=A0ACC1IES8_9FUNG|nr:hypothetical protein LPJ66_005252 [Kickxella alabastrina]